MYMCNKSKIGYKGTEEDLYLNIKKAYKVFNEKCRCI